MIGWEAAADVSSSRTGRTLIVSAIGDLGAHTQLIVELVEKSRLPAIYPHRGYKEAGGLMAYLNDSRELWRRMADADEVIE